MRAHLIRIKWRVWQVVVVVTFAMITIAVVLPTIRDYVCVQQIITAVTTQNFKSIRHGRRTHTWLIKNGKRVVPELTELSENENWEVSACAAYLLAEIGTDAKGSISTLVQLIADDRSPVLRIRAVEALGEIAPRTSDCKAVVKEVQRALDDEHFQVRSTAAATLRLFGSDAELVAERLVEMLLNDESAYVRGQVAYAMGGMGGCRDTVLPVLYDVKTREKDPDVISHIESTIWELETGGISARTRWYQVRVPLW